VSQPSGSPRESVDIPHDYIRLPREVEEIWNDKGAFVDKGPITAVTIFSSTDRSKCTASSQTMTADKIPGWLGQELDFSERGSYTMRLLICPKFEDRSSSYPFTMNKEAMRKVVEAMQLPSSWISLVPQHNARYCRIYGPDTEGFIMHMRNPGFSFITTYKHGGEQLINGLILGLSSEDISKVVENISTFDLTCFPPILVSICLLELMATWIDKTSTQCYEKLIKTEKSIGTFTDYLLRPFKPAARDDWLTKIPSQDVARDLTIISTSVSRTEHSCTVGEKMLLTAEESYDAYLESLPTKEAERSRNSKANTTLLTRMSELRSSFQVLMLEGQFYLRRTDANRQTIYSLIAQKDNMTNLKIAEYSLAESANMKKIAETNTRDSAAMVVISIVTAAFLPGTFISSLFSTTIFNFQNGDNHVVSTKWHGIYWAITAPLTIFILATWYLFWQLRKRRDEERFKDKDHGRGEELSRQLSKTMFPSRENGINTMAGAEKY